MTRAPRRHPRIVASVNAVAVCVLCGEHPEPGEARSTQRETLIRAPRVAPPVPPPTLRGERTMLRAVVESDLAFCHAFANDPGLRPSLRFEQPTSWESERAWLHGLDDPGQGATWVICALPDERSIGMFSLTSWNKVARHAELGIAILSTGDRGRGHGEEAIRLGLAHAFSERGMNLQRVHLTVYDHNPARALYERMGFRHEGTLRRHAYKEGAYRGVHHYGMLREDWLEARP